jgi:hypothetical protein
MTLKVAAVAVNAPAFSPIGVSAGRVKPVTVELAPDDAGTTKIDCALRQNENSARPATAAICLLRMSTSLKT